MMKMDIIYYIYICIYIMEIKYSVLIYLHMIKYVTFSTKISPTHRIYNRKINY